MTNILIPRRRKEYATYRGYMNDEEINRHVNKKIGYGAGVNEKIAYFEKILKKENLLSSKTRENVYYWLAREYSGAGRWSDSERLAETNEPAREGAFWGALFGGYSGSNYKLAERLAERLGEKSQIKVLEMYIKRGDWKGVERIAEGLDRRKKQENKERTDYSILAFAGGRLF